MLVPVLALRDQSLQKFLQILPGGWIITLADNQRSAGMLQEEVADPFSHAPILQALVDGFGEGIQTFPL
jgi:hypothetical protein